MSKPTYRAVEVVQANGPLQLVDREIQEPGPGQVRIRIHACGVCHSDSVTVQGLFPGIQYPRVPGHEIAGVIDALGAGVPKWQVGQRVGVGWFGGNCGYCESCRRGDFITCSIGPVPGIQYDGGYAEYTIGSVLGARAYSRRAFRRGSRTADVCRHYHLQRVEE